MKVISNKGSLYTYELNVKNEESGLIGYSLRVMANHPDLVNRFHFSKVVWG